jgi:hypothetical protein
MMVFVAGRTVIDLPEGARVPVAWDSDGTPMYRDDPPRFFEIHAFEGDEYDDPEMLR